MVIKKDTKIKLSPLTISLHWVVGITMISLIIFDIKYPVFHQSIGTLILLFVVIRIIWRIENGWPYPTAVYSKLEQITAKLVHWVLILGTLLLPISGLLISGAGGYGLDIFSFELLAPNLDPENSGEIIPLNKTLADSGHLLHTPLSNLMIIAILLHISGAFKHHFIDKDMILKRMLGLKK